MASYIMKDKYNFSEPPRIDGLVDTFAEPYKKVYNLRSQYLQDRGRNRARNQVITALDENPDMTETELGSTAARAFLPVMDISNVDDMIRAIKPLGKKGSSNDISTADGIIKAAGQFSSYNKHPKALQSLRNGILKAAEGLSDPEAKNRLTQFAATIPVTEETGSGDDPYTAKPLRRQDGSEIPGVYGIPKEGGGVMVVREQVSRAGRTLRQDAEDAWRNGDMAAVQKFAEASKKITAMASKDPAPSRTTINYSFGEGVDADGNPVFTRRNPKDGSIVPVETGVRPKQQSAGRDPAWELTKQIASKVPKDAAVKAYDTFMPSYKKFKANYELYLDAVEKMGAGTASGAEINMVYGFMNGLDGSVVKETEIQMILSTTPYLRQISQIVSAFFNGGFKLPKESYTALFEALDASFQIIKSVRDEKLSEYAAGAREAGADVTRLGALEPSLRPFLASGTQNVGAPPASSSQVLQDLEGLFGE